MWKTLSRSELLSTFFPTWIWQGREWSKGRIPKYDPYFWLVQDAHPVTSTYYPPAIISSYVASWTKSLDVAFCILSCFIVLHSLGAFIGWLLLLHGLANPLIAIFGAITFTFAAYNWKQQPCFQYTIAWFPWLLTGISNHNILLTSIAFGMILLAGYYPIGIQIALVAGCATALWNCPPYWVPIGVLIGLPQLVPFIKYLPKTIRTKKVSGIGKVPWWHPITLIFPLRKNFNGVGYWEMSYYIGITPLLLIAYKFNLNKYSIVCLFYYFLMIGLFNRFLPRIPARWCFSFQFCLIWMALKGLIALNLSNTQIFGLCLIQVFDLWLHNSKLLVNHPYAELYKKPSWTFNTALTGYLTKNLGSARISGLPYPLFTGLINNFRTLGYSGGMQLKLMAKWRKDNNPDGGGEHDFFRSNKDHGELSRYRVKFAYSRKKLNWIGTGIPHLYLNPTYASGKH